MKLRYIIIKVKDIERAKSFYSRLLDMQPTKEEVNRIVVFNLDNIKIGLYNPLFDGDSIKDSDFGTNCRPAFGTDDVQSELERISEFAEITSQHKVDLHEWFEFKDSEGNPLEVHKI
jgi:catechol 2,3-dioxygenase-like lactoylglutathione lyase family enzyme